MMTVGRVLVLNTGSATLKATVLDLPSLEPTSTAEVGWSPRSGVAAIGASVDEVIDTIRDDGTDLSSLAAVGHRVVHGGERFRAATVVDDAVLAALEALADLAPIHQPLAIATMRTARTRLPGVPHVAVFDTAFHASLPEAGHRYAVPDAWFREYGVRRYGFHGLSVAWSVRRAGELLDRPVEVLRVIVVHLGGGCSVTAVDGGRSVDTSMGLTPLEGLMMGTRSGSIDPGIIFRLVRRGLPIGDIEAALDRGSGLLGVGGTDDVRRLLSLAAGGDTRAAFALDLFVRRAAAAIAAASTTLDGLDAVIFTGGIGARASTVRTRICARLTGIGVPAVPEVDVRPDTIVSRADDGRCVIVIDSREDVVIAEAALAASV